MDESATALKDELIRLLSLIQMEREAGQKAYVELLTAKAARCLIKLADATATDEHLRGLRNDERV